MERRGSRDRGSAVMEIGCAVAAQVAEPLRYDWSHVGLVGHWLGGGVPGDDTPGCYDNGGEKVNKLGGKEKKHQRPYDSCW